MADHFNMSYSEISAKTNENLNETINNFTRKIVADFENRKTQSKESNLDKKKLSEENGFQFSSKCTC